MVGALYCIPAIFPDQIIMRGVINEKNNSQRRVIKRDKRKRK